MAQSPTWIVRLYISGPVSVENKIKFSALKGWQSDSDPFYSDIEIKNNRRNGLKVFVSAFAPTKHLANQAALLFFGQILDTLAIKINLPMSLSLFDKNMIRDEEHTTRRVVQTDEWKSAYYETLRLKGEQTFMRAMGWYRKGLYTEDPIDKFLAFWNSIGIISTKYHPDNENSSKGSKSQMWECFKSLWGDVADWPIIPNQKSWIDDNYEIRTSIAHGTITVDVQEIGKIIDKIQIIEDVAHRFIDDWRLNKLDNINRND